MSQTQEGQLTQHSPGERIYIKQRLLPIKQPPIAGNQNDRDKQSSDDPFKKPRYGDPTWWLDTPQTIFTLILAVIGLLGFGIAIRAANAAKKGAEVAERSMRVTEEVLTTLERPYIFIANINVAVTSWADNSLSAVMRLTLWNVGKSPAILYSYRMGFEIGSELPVTPPNDKLHVTEFLLPRPVPVDKYFKLSSLQSPRMGPPYPASANGPWLYFIAKVSYRDFMGRPYELGCAWKIELRPGSPIPAGGEIYNFYEGPKT